MTRSDRDQRTDLRDDMREARASPLEPPQLTTPRRALWSAASMLAIVAVMFGVFYGINAQHTRSSPASAAITTSSPDQTTGQR